MISNIECVDVVFQERTAAIPIDLDDDSSSVQSQDTDKCKRLAYCCPEVPPKINLKFLLVPETPQSGSKLSKGSSKESTPIPEVSPEVSPPRPPSSVTSNSDSSNRKRLAEETTKETKEDERKPVSDLKVAIQLRKYLITILLLSRSLPKRKRDLPRHHPQRQFPLLLCQPSEMFLRHRHKRLQSLPTTKSTLMSNRNRSWSKLRRRHPFCHLFFRRHRKRRRRMVGLV